MVRPRLIDMKPDQLGYYPFMISMDRCDGSWNAVEDPFRRLCFPNNMEDVEPGTLILSKE